MDVLADETQRLKLAANISTSDDSDPDTKKHVKLPPYVHRFKYTSDPDSPKWNVDDRIIWNDVNYYFCYWPTHKDKLKWYTHKAETFRTRKRWLESKNCTRTSLSNYKSPNQEILANKSTIITEPYDSSTATYDITYALTEILVSYALCFSSIVVMTRLVILWVNFIGL